MANPDDPGTTYISLVGNTYARLITGEQTNGRYCLIDMRVPDGGGPPPQLSEEELAERRRRAAELASTYRSEFL